MTNLCLGGLSAPVQGVHLRKEAVILGALYVILVMPVSRLHMELDELEDEATP